MAIESELALSDQPRGIEFDGVWKLVEFDKFEM